MNKIITITEQNTLHTLQVVVEDDTEECLEALLLYADYYFGSSDLLVGVQRYSPLYYKPLRCYPFFDPKVGKPQPH